MTASIWDSFQLLNFNFRGNIQKILSCLFSMSDIISNTNIVWYISVVLHKKQNGNWKKVLGSTPRQRFAM